MMHQPMPTIVRQFRFSTHCKRRNVGVVAEPDFAYVVATIRADGCWKVVEVGFEAPVGKVGGVRLVEDRHCFVVNQLGDTYFVCR